MDSFYICMHKYLHASTMYIYKRPQSIYLPGGGGGVRATVLDSVVQFKHQYTIHILCFASQLSSGKGK